MDTDKIQQRYSKEHKNHSTIPKINGRPGLIPYQQVQSKNTVLKTKEPQSVKNLLMHLSHDSSASRRFNA
jgi:hypothetical protein